MPVLPYTHVAHVRHKPIQKCPHVYITTSYYLLWKYLRRALLRILTAGRPRATIAQSHATPMYSHTYGPSRFRVAPKNTKRKLPSTSSASFYSVEVSIYVGGKQRQECDVNRKATHTYTGGKKLAFLACPPFWVATGRRVAHAHEGGEHFVQLDKVHVPCSPRARGREDIPDTCPESLEV